MLAMWSSGCQCLLNIVVIFEPLQCLFHKAVPLLFQTLKLSTLLYLYLSDITFVYSASYGPKTVLMTWESHPVKYWLLRDCYPMTSECHQIRQRRVTCSIKQADFLTNCTINQLKLKHVPFFPRLFQNICFYNINLWALNSADKISTRTVNFIFDGQDMEMQLIEVMTSMCGWLN